MSWVEYCVKLCNKISQNCYHLPISFSFFSTQNKTKRTVASETQRVSEAQSQRHGAIVFCFNRELASCPRNHPCAVLVLSNKHIYKLCTVSFYIDHSSSSMHANLVSYEMSHATSYMNNFHKTNYQQSFTIVYTQFKYRSSHNQG